MSVVICYLDESGTDDLSPTAVVGGILLNRSGFRGFSDHWEALLKKHSIPAIHMKEFQRHGKLGHLSDDQRRAIFTDAVAVIKTYRIHTIAATLTTANYAKHFARIMPKDVMSVYGMCFILVAVLNHNQARHSTPPYSDRIGYLMDAGNIYAEQVRKAHATMHEWQQTEFLHVGGLDFDDDEEVLPLQGSDMIAWTARRVLT